MRLEDLLSTHENETLDFKRDLSSKKGIVKDICAFANTNGGTLVIGVADDRSVVGLKDPEGAEEKLINIVSDGLEPRPNVQVRFASHEGKEVMLVTLPFQDGPVHLKDKPLEEGTFGRYGSESRLVDAGRLAELRRYRESRSWDELPCLGATRDDFNFELAERIFNERGVAYTEAVLRTCKLLTDRGGELVPTNGGIVLFGKDRAKHHLDDARWRCIRYPGTDKGTTAMDDMDYEQLTVVEALPVVLDYVLERVGTIRSIQGLTREDSPAVSANVLREVLVNAMAHANYEVKGSRLNVSVYSDRVEVQSPGAWPPAYGFEDFRDGISQVRNRGIARTLRTLRYMEEHGTAWARVQEAATEGYPEPTWEPRGPVLRVSIPKIPVFPNPQNESGNLGQAEDGRAKRAAVRRAKMLAVLGEHGVAGISVKELAKLIDSGGSTTLYRDISELEEQGAVRRVGRGHVAIVEQ